MIVLPTACGRLSAPDELPKTATRPTKLCEAGFELVSGGGKGSHRKFTHVRFSGAVTISGQDGDDAKKYQEKQVKRAIEEVER